MNDRDENAMQASAVEGERNPLLRALGERLRLLRARRGMTRRVVAMTADVSERHLANLENGTGNASLLVLDQIARALHCPLAELVGDVSTSSPEWLLLRELLDGRSEADLRMARMAVGEVLGTGGDRRSKGRRVALVGLRGAGKSTLGQMLAEDLGVPFIELSHVIETTTGYSIREIHDLYGTSAYRRYERRALEEAIQIHPEMVLATPGGLVSDPSTFNILLAHCNTVWLRASPEEHMGRVASQGDMRPMAASREAMEDLKEILASREPFYSKADLRLDTSGQPLEQSFRVLRDEVRALLK